MSETLIHYEFACAQCGKIAARFTLVPAGVALEPNDLWSDRARLRREGFMGTSVNFLETEKLRLIFQALAQRDYQTIAREVHLDLVGFHCHQCNADYCEDCWDIGPPEFDEDLPGFYDCTAAVCPKGHEQIVDD
jgi:hypothetical protein